MSDECCVIPEKGFCPLCHKKGRATGRDVPSLHLKPEALSKTTGWAEVSVCLNPDCEALYFEGSQWVSHKDSKTRVGYKEKEAPHPLCYCFNHSGEEILGQIEATGKSQAVEDIKKEVNAGTCRCEITNPTGGCCLSTINEFVKRNTQEQKQKTLNASGKVSVKAMGVLSMLTVSACCGVPLLLAVLGLGGFLGVAHVYISLLGFLLLGAGYYFYFREKKACAAHGCAMPGQKTTLLVLILSTLFVMGFTVWESGVFAAQGDACCTISAHSSK